MHEIITRSFTGKANQMARTDAPKLTAVYKQDPQRNENEKISSPTCRRRRLHGLSTFLLFV